MHACTWLGNFVKSWGTPGCNFSVKTMTIQSNLWAEIFVDLWFTLYLGTKQECQTGYCEYGETCDKCHENEVCQICICNRKACLKKIFQRTASFMQHIISADFKMTLHLCTQSLKWITNSLGFGGAIWCVICVCSLQNRGKLEIYKY